MQRQQNAQAWDWCPKKFKITRGSQGGCVGDSCSCPWRLVGRLGVEKSTPFNRRSRTSVFHSDVHGTRRAGAHLASPSNDLETHIQDVLGVLQFEDLREVILIGHSYGGMVATGVADRAPDRIARLIYLDAFVPSHGHTLIDLLPSDERQRLLDSIRTGDGWRVTPNPIPPDTTSEDAEWIAKFRMPQSAKCFEQPLYLQTSISLPRAYIHCTRYADKKPFAQFANLANREAGWESFELDASHSPNVTAPVALTDLLKRVLSEQ